MPHQNRHWLGRVPIGYLLGGILMCVVLLLGLAKSLLQDAGVYDVHLQDTNPDAGFGEVTLQDTNTEVISYVQEAYLKAAQLRPGDSFGGSLSGGPAIAMSGDIIVVGAQCDTNTGLGINPELEGNTADVSGAVYVFRRTEGQWSQEAYLKASNAEAGDAFGTAVAVSADTIVVGADQEDGGSSGVNGGDADNSAKNSGAAYVFRYLEGQWVQEAYLKSSNSEAGDSFGSAVAICGDTLVVGAPDERAGPDMDGVGPETRRSPSGAAYVFRRNDEGWIQKACLTGSETTAGDSFGVTVGISGDSIAVGVGQYQFSNPGTGAVYVFRMSQESWVEEAHLTPPHGDPEDCFEAVDISGDTLVVGARYESSAAVGVNGNTNDNSAEKSGAAYVYRRNDRTWELDAYLKAFNSDAGDSFGERVAVDGDIVAVGASREGSEARGVNGNGGVDRALFSGAVHVFRRRTGRWIQVAYLKAFNTDSIDQFGSSVAIDDGTIVVGAQGEDSVAKTVNGDPQDNSAEESGAAYVFRPQEPQ